MKKILIALALAAALFGTAACEGLEVEDTGPKKSTNSGTDPKPAGKEAKDDQKAETGENPKQKNARQKAEDYLALSGFSRKGLIDQLKFEGFSQKLAVYGADNSGAKWLDEAAEKAKEYLDMTAFSKQGLIDQLKFEGFTQEQAEHGATAAGL